MFKKILFTLFLGFMTLQIKAQTKFYLFTGSYTQPKGKGEGIEVYVFDTKDGTAKFVSSIKAENPSYLALSSDGKFLYSVNQNGKDKPNEASAFSFDKTKGELHFINKESVGGEGPCYISIDSKSKWLFTANYFAGSLSALPINKDGSVGALKQLIEHKVGSNVIRDRQADAHVHTCVFSPNEKFLFTCDLGKDQVNQYRFNPSSQEQPLSVGDDSVTNFTPGSGPRHIAFHPNNKYVYVVNELNGTIDAFGYDNGKLTPIQNISTDKSSNLDKGSGDIHLSPDGKFLYTTDRGKYNTISSFKVNEKTGELSLVDIQPTQGATPRNFIIDPTGNYLLVANQNGDNIVIYKRDVQTGILTATGKEIKTGTPVCLKMLAIN